MITKNELDITLNKMILSASGWRGVFAENGDEESKDARISQAHQIISGAAAYVFSDFLTHPAPKVLGTGQGGAENTDGVLSKPLVLLGTDTRPTGEAIINAMIPVLLARGCEVLYAGVTAAPEIMAWARTKNFTTNQYEPSRTGEKKVNCGFIYVSASHNPVGHNGLKFGLTDGGVIGADESSKLITNFRAFMEKDDNIAKIESLMKDSSVSVQNIQKSKEEAFKAYYNFCSEVVWGAQSSDAPSIAAALKDGLEKQPLGIVCDFNGSARTVSIDRDFFHALGFKFECINEEPGQITHRIVPEGESLEPCARLLEEAHKRDSSFVLGYVPDCDGDRGNLVIFDDKINKARVLEAQEVFALACVAEFSHLVWSGELVYDSNGETLSKAAIAINDPTSMRVDRIAQAFGISVFRAEVGEANVVSLARKLREEGYIVRILGEGSAGGNITHPSAVRDPLNTVLAIAKLLSVRSTAEKPGLFEIWCRLSGQTEKYRDDFTLADIITSLPPFTSTPAYSKDAVLRIETNDHGILKDRYQQIFIKEWEKQKDELKIRFGFYGWEAIAYNGIVEKRGLKNFGEAGRGGLKVLFIDDEGSEIAYIWMRGSATEPVFRIMADVLGNDESIERFLLDWQQKMILKADEK